MALKNRVADNINRRKLNVVNTSYDASGNITSLTVDVIRNEGNVSSEGTPLTAESLNAEITEVVKKVVSSGSIAETKCECDYSNSVATTAFVWDVLTALGFLRKYHNHDTGGGSGSSGT